MDSKNSGQLLDLLELLTNIVLLPREATNKDPCNGEETFTTRGLPNIDNGNRSKLKQELMGKKRRDNMVRNIDHLKDLISQRNEEGSLRQLGKMINEVTTTDQKRLFLKEIVVEEKSRNPQYIPWVAHNDYVDTEGGLRSRSGVPQLSNEVMESINMHSLNDSLETQVFPAQISQNDSSQQYLVNKGIYYCRVLLTKFFCEKDNTILKELKSRNILIRVLNDMIQNDKNYIMNLADNYPNSYQEIFFIMKEDRSAILNSSIFVNMAKRSINHLYQFLTQLVADGVDKKDLSRYCDESNFNGLRVYHLLLSNKQEDSIHNNKIEKFLQRHKQSQ